MTIRFEQQNKAVHLVATNDDGHQAHLDGSEAIGGEGKGFSPMRMLEGTAKITSAYILNDSEEVPVATVGPEYLVPKTED